MKVSYNGLWKILIDKNMNVLYRIGIKLNVDFGDMVSIVEEGK